MTTTTDDRYLRPQEMAEYSSFSVRQLQRLAADPHHPLPVHRVGGRVLYKRSEFDQWLREHEERAPARPSDRAYRIALAIRGHQR